MTEEEWQRYRLAFLGRTNNYLPDTPEARRQHDPEFDRPGDVLQVETAPVETSDKMRRSMKRKDVP